MDVDEIITQIRTYAPVFEGRVAGAADYATGLETVVSMPLPACYVYPIADAVEETSGMGGSLRQQITERIAVVVELDNSADRRGQAAVTSVHAMKAALFAAVLNWNPASYGSSVVNGMFYSAGRLLGFDRARLFWEFEFSIIRSITQFDGFIPPAQPLEEIDIFDPNHPPLQVRILIQDGAAIASSISFSATAHIA